LWAPVVEPTKTEVSIMGNDSESVVLKAWYGNRLDKPKNSVVRLVASSVLIRFNNASVLIVNSLLSILIKQMHSLLRQTALLLRWTVLLLG
jgi:hypothetical protein